MKNKKRCQHSLPSWLMAGLAVKSACWAEVTVETTPSKSNQTIGAIKFKPATLAVGSTTMVKATATSGLPVRFISTTRAICATSGINGGTVTGEATGVCTIEAHQGGNASYNAAPKVTKSINISKANQSIGIISFTSVTLAVGSTTTVKATATSGLPVRFSPTTPTICATSGVNGSTVTGMSAGVCTIAANQDGNAKYNAAPMVTNTLTVSNGSDPTFTLEQTLSDQAQITTLAFDGLAMMTGNLEAQSFFPPGKVADYTGFQYLRDNDPDDMGHNTSFLTRIANNVIYILNENQFGQLKALAASQLTGVNLYGYKRFSLMKAFRRLFDDDIPVGSTGLNLNAVKLASRELYILDGQISFDRAVLYANVLNSMDSTQKSYLDAMKGKGFKSWPDVTNDQINSKMQGLPPGTAQAVMTYASDIFSWYAGSLDADVYFCPERHGTYYGGFYIKDAPAVGHEGYSISEQLTATAGAALSDSSKGYVTPTQAAVMSNLVNIQRNNLYASPTANIIQTRTQIATLLRSLMTSTASSESVNNQVLALSGTYGDLDGENNYQYATVFAQVYRTLTSSQENKLKSLRESILSGTYADGTPFDYSVCTTFFLYSDVITDDSVITPYTENTDDLFFEPSN